MIPRLVVACLAAAGALVVARAASLYRGSDPIAHAMVLVIGGVFAVGVVELFVRAQRASKNASALSEIEKVAATDPVDGPRAALAAAPAPVRLALEVRLRGGGGSPAPVHLSAYLLGLLVMLGLFGTFLGLFETLGGARQALTESADVTALRAGLAAPMRGLSRAFGTSAAGVATSALLGLAAVFVRRAEARAAGLATRLVTGALFPLGAPGRQLAALEAIVETRESLPAAARAIEVATERLAALSETLLATQRATGEGLATALDATAARVQADLAAGIARASSAIEPLLDRAVTRAGEGAAVAVSAWTSALESDLASRRARDEAHDVALLAASERLLGTLRAELAAAAEAAAARDVARSARLEALASALDGRATAHLEKLDVLAQRADEREGERLAKLDVLAQRADEREGERLAKLDELAAKTDAHTRGLREELAGLGRDAALRDRERADTIEALAAALAQRDAAGRAARDASEESAREREAARSAALEAWAQAVVEREEARLARLDALAAASAEREDRRLAELQALSAEGALRDAARLSVLEDLAEAAARRDADRAARLDALVAELVGSDRARLAKVDELVGALGACESARLAALERLGDDAARRDEQRLRRLEATASELCERADLRAAAVEQRVATQVATWDRLVEAGATREAKHLEAVAALAESLARGASDVQRELADQAARLGSLAEAQSDLGRERALAEVSRERRFLELAAAIERLAAQTSSELQSTASRVGEEIALGVGVAVEGLAPAVASVAERAASAAAAQVERLSEQADQRDRERLAVIERSAEQIGAHASEAARRTEELPRVLGEFLAEEDARQAARAERDRAREASVDALLARLGELAASLDAREGDRAAALELFEEKLSADRDSAAAALGERLAEHAAGLAASIAEVTKVVLSAAESVKAGGGELALVAEMFTSAVDRYRQGSEQWLDTLASLETALEKKAGGEAPDLLGAYLDRTREVFDHSLAFQRELFAELRAVKASVARPAVAARGLLSAPELAEADVSLAGAPSGALVEGAPARALGARNGRGGAMPKAES